MTKTYQSITIDAPLEKVWSTIRDFHDMTWAPNVITNLEKSGDLPGDTVEAKRKLNGVFEETLAAIDDAERTFSYRITNGPSPLSRAEVKNYIGRVVVKPVPEGNGTFVEWSSSWENRDERIYEFCHGIYVALLEDMKKSLE